MKQLLQNLKSGAVEFLEVPAPSCSSSGLVIQTRTSLISAGTERMLNSFAKGSYIEKARQQPDKVKQVINKAKTDGIMTTVNAVRQKLDQPLPLGYSNVGVVLEKGPNVTDIAIGDRVLSNGPHSEIVGIAKNLVVRIPDEVDDEAASFTVVGAIGLQGIRLIAPEIGETVCVAGLGLIGLVAVQILVANGCRVFGFDHSAERVALAKSYGAHAIQITEGVDVVNAAMGYTNNVGVDAVLITASTSSNDLIAQCAHMCRKRGRIVLTGVTGLKLDRADFYEKELTFQVSCSYGPGRYEHAFENRSLDYPIGFVRWTETRNFEAILELMRSGRINVEKLITGRHAFEDAASAYADLSNPSSLGLLLQYPQSSEPVPQRVVRYAESESVRTRSKARLAVIGSGNFTQATLLPALKKSNADVQAIASSQGTSAAIAAKRFGIPEATSDTNALYTREDIDAVMITTPHNTHASMVLSAMEAGKHVFVEKPLCLTEEELDQIIEARQSAKSSDMYTPMVMVGFNRRFAPMMVDMKAMMAGRKSPAFININCNAGHLPADHWTQDPARGGGRILGEACHFIDIARHLIGAPITSISAIKMHGGSELSEDTVAITLGFEDGSLAAVNYFSNGSAQLPKETYAASWESKSVELNNFRKLTGYGISKKSRAMQQDKGHAAECAAFIKSLQEGSPCPIPFDEIENVMRATFAALKAMRDGIQVQL